MDDTLKEVLDQIYEDIWGRFDNSHMWTFAEFKPSEEKIINKYSEIPLVHAISTENIRAAMEKISEEQKKDWVTVQLQISTIGTPNRNKNILNIDKPETKEEPDANKGSN